MNWVFYITFMVVLIIVVFAAFADPLPVWLTSLPHGFVEPGIIERTVP